MRLERLLGALAKNAIHAALGVEADPVLRPTADAKHGDYQVNGVLPLAKREKKNPRELADLVAKELEKQGAFAGVEVAGPGFVNLRLTPAWLAGALAESKGGTALEPVEKREKIVVDYSSPNIAKQMHVGHLRSTILGAAVVSLLRAVGHEVVGDNHLGDWGTQFGLLIVGMRRFGSEEALEKTPIEELERVYKLATAAAKEDEATAAEARAELAKLQSGDAANRALWQRFIDVTRKSLDVIYARLGVGFDLWLGESFFDPMLPGTCQLLEEKGLARTDEGALCIFFPELEGAPADLKKIKEPFIVRKSDGAYLYASTDVATALYRDREMHTDRNLYVVDARQGLHFKQVFAVAKLLGLPQRFEHVSFGSVLGEDGKPLKTRDGKAITLASLLDEAESRAAERIREEGLDVPEEELAEAARAVGVGAVKWADLKQNRTSDYVFSWEKLISFKGNSGPYVQYAHARIASLFRKGGLERAAYLGGALTLEAPEEKELGKRLALFADVVHAAAETAQPHLVCDHLYELARVFSGFYEACPVLKSEGETRESRLRLAAATAEQLRQGLTLLGIAAIERM
jgi:arginyl-tRNA synthetase